MRKKRMYVQRNDIIPLVVTIEHRYVECSVISVTYTNRFHCEMCSVVHELYINERPRRVTITSTKDYTRLNAKRVGECQHAKQVQCTNIIRTFCNIVRNVRMLIPNSRLTTQLLSCHIEVIIRMA